MAIKDLKFKSLNEAWRAFESQVFFDAPAEARNDLRKAFYVGADTAYVLLMEAPGPGDDEDVSPELATFLQGVSDELDVFREEIKSSYARSAPVDPKQVN